MKQNPCRQHSRFKKDQAKDLGLTFDSKLDWKQHILMKRKQMDQKIKDLYWLIGKKSIDNKPQIYKAVSKTNIDLKKVVFWF